MLRSVQHKFHSSHKRLLKDVYYLIITPSEAPESRKKPLRFKSSISKTNMS